MQFPQFFHEIFLPLLEKKVIIRTVIYKGYCYEIENFDIDEEWAEKEFSSGSYPLFADLSKVAWSEEVRFRSHPIGFIYFVCWSEPFYCTFETNALSIRGNFSIKLLHSNINRHKICIVMEDRQQLKTNEKLPVLNDQGVWEFEGEGKKTKSCRN